RLTSYLLKRLGCRFSLASNGQEAIQAIEHDHFHIVLMDCQMPILDGYESTRIIRQSLKSQIYIAAMTAHAMQGDREKCLDAGMDDYLVKPIRLQALLEVLMRGCWRSVERGLVEPV